MLVLPPDIKKIMVRRHEELQIYVCFFLHNDVFASFWVLLHLTGYVLMGATCSDLSYRHT